MMKLIEERITESIPGKSRAIREAKINELKQVAGEIKISLPVKKADAPELDVRTAYKYADALLEITEWLVETYIRNRK